MSSDEEAVVSVRKKKFVVDSDGSDEEENKKPPTTVNKTSSEESEETVVEENSSKINKKKKTIHRIKAFKDSSSESDSESERNFQNNSFKKSTKKDIEVKPESNSESKVEPTDLTESPKPEETTKNSWYKNSDLFENESSEEENGHHSDNEGPDSKRSSDEEDISFGKSRRTVLDEEKPTKKSKGKPKKAVQEKQERKSKKKAQEEIAEIHKETQRMMRESRVSIPYHRPRQRTLAEFLERRKASPVVSLKTSTDQLQSAWKALEEREKEAEIFYKSESSEDETEKEDAVQNKQESTSPASGSVAEIIVSKLSEEIPPNSLTLNNEEELSIMETREQNLEDDRESPHKTGNNDDNNSTIKNTEDFLNGNENCEPSSFENDQEVIVTGNPDTAHNKGNSEKSVEEQNKRITEHNEVLPTDEGMSVNTDLDSEEIKVSAANTPSNDNSTLEKETSCGNTENFSLRMSESHSEGDSFSNLTENVVSKDSNSKIPNQAKETSMEFSENISTTNTEEFSLRMSESQSENVSFIKADELVLSSQEKTPSTESGDVKDGKENSKDSSMIIAGTEKNNVDGEIIEPDMDQNEKVVHKIISTDVKTSDKVADSLEQKLREKYNFEPKNPVVGLRMKEPSGGVINLEDVSFNPGVNELMTRFQTHMSYKKKPTKKKTELELSVVSAETDASGHVTSVTEEMVKVLVGGEEEEADPTLAKPGAKLARLKAHLQAEMGRQREQQWAEKQKETKLYEEEIYEDEKDVCDMEQEAEDNESEAEAENSESDGEEADAEEEEEEEEEEDEDEDTEEKPKKKSVFVDDEAEESEDDNVGEEDDEDTFIKRPTKKKVILQRTPTADMFLSQEVLKQQNTEEEDLPPFQKPQPVEDKTDEQMSESSSVCASPAFPLTGLEGKVNNYDWSAPTTPCKDFVNPKTVTPMRVRAQLVSKSPQMCTQDLEHLCSGEFTSQTTQQLEETQETEDFKLFLEDSQLSLDTTPVKPSPKTKTQNDEKETMRSLLVEDDDDLSTTLVNKKVKKLNFSDDEDDGENVPNEKAEESDAHSEDEAEAEEEGVEADEEGAEVDEVGVEADEVAYDSEENEVVKTAGDFLDKEAELSESEWGSEDEDEHGLDALEMEEADREKIDQRKLKLQLDQMHMKQMLIEDKKQVRMLQEVLLEDGELHSENKRQRLFRWSNNADFTEDDNKARLDSDEEKGEDDEDEENWRRTRHEREQYLLENKKKVEKLELEFEEESDSQLMRLGQKALKRMNSNSQEPKLTPPVTGSPDAKKPYRQLTTRGSFLARGERVLSRLGQMTSSDGPVNQPKNSRNFVFSRVSPTKDVEEVKPLAVVQPNKRKKFELPLPVAKKPCIQKPKVANKKSLFDALFKAKS